MIVFRHPWVLLLFLALPVLVILRYGKRRRAALTFSNGAALAGLPISPWLTLRWLPAALYVLGLAGVILALGRPQRGLIEAQVETEGIDIVLLVDTSTSMRAEDFSTATRRMNRLDAAKNVMEQFVRARPNDRMGVISFAAMPYTIAPLTTDHAWLLLQMERLTTGMLEDGTAIGDALASGINRLRESQAKSKIIILLTDGIQNAGRLMPLDAARAAEALGIKIYAIGAASDQPRGGMGLFAFAPKQAEIDEELLSQVAEITGGSYFRATHLKSLEETYRQIDEMEKTTIEMDQYTRYEDLFGIFLAWGLLGLFGESLLVCTRMGRLP